MSYTWSPLGCYIYILTPTAAFILFGGVGSERDLSVTYFNHAYECTQPYPRFSIHPFFVSSTVGILHKVNKYF